MAIIHPKDAITIFKGGKNRKTVVRKGVRSPAFHPPGKITSYKGGKMGNTEERKRVRCPAFHPPRKNSKP